MGEFLNCPCAGDTLDKLIQPAILAVLAQEPSHGYRLAETIGAMPGVFARKPDISGIYRVLRSMDAKGLVVSSWDTPGAGHAKRRYAITRAGQACLSRWVETLDDYLTSLRGLLRIARTAATRTGTRKQTRSGRKPAARLPR